MTENSNPLAGFDINSLMEQAVAMQQQVAAASDQLATMEIEGSVGGGAVTVTVNGTGEFLGIKIAKGSFDAEEPEDLEDMILAAYREARGRADQAASEALGPLSGLGDALGGGGAPLGF